MLSWVRLSQGDPAEGYSAASCTSISACHWLRPSTSRISPPCSSSEPPNRRRVPPEFDARRRSPPCPLRLLQCSPGTFPGLFRRARSETWPSPSLHLLDDLLQILSHSWNGLACELHSSTGAFSHHDVEAAILLVLAGKIIAEMRPTALFSLQRRPGNNFRYRQQAVQVERRVPSRIVFSVSGHADSLTGSLQLSKALERLQHLLFLTYDPHQFLHHVFQCMLDGLWIVGALALEGLQHRFFR